MAGNEFSSHSLWSWSFVRAEQCTVWFKNHMIPLIGIYEPGEEMMIWKPPTRKRTSSREHHQHALCIRGVRSIVTRLNISLMWYWHGRSNPCRPSQLPRQHLDERLYPDRRGDQAQNTRLEQRKLTRSTCGIILIFAEIESLCVLWHSTFSLVVWLREVRVCVLKIFIVWDFWSVKFARYRLNWIERSHKWCAR